jgi:hypothetical protein
VRRGCTGLRAALSSSGIALLPGERRHTVIKIFLDFFLNLLVLDVLSPYT